MYTALCNFLLDETFMDGWCSVPVLLKFNPEKVKAHTYVYTVVQCLQQF